MKKINKKVSIPKLVLLYNPMNNESWCCDDYDNVKNIDGEEFITVYKPENTKRTFLMKKNALKLLDRKNYPKI